MTNTGDREKCRGNELGILDIRLGLPDFTALQAHFGDRLTFWGGGVDTRKTPSRAAGMDRPRKTPNHLAAPTVQRSYSCTMGSAAED